MLADSGQTSDGRCSYESSRDRGRATGTSTSARSCTRLLTHFARRAAGGGDGRSRSVYRDARERNDPHASEDNRSKWRPNREEATRTWNRSAIAHSIDYRDRRSINYLARSQIRCPLWIYGPSDNSLGITAPDLPRTVRHPRNRRH